MASVTYSVLKRAFCNEATSRTQTFKWYSHFKSGQTWLGILNIQSSIISWTDENMEKYVK
jgi:hypothetical protein